MYKPFHMILAPDSFKGTLSSREVIECLSAAADEILPGTKITAFPIADGGEGTVEAMAEGAAGTVDVQEVTGPLGEAVSARWALLPDGTCVLEMAQASGLPLVPADRRDPRFTTTRGTGEQLARLIGAGHRRFLLGLGGSGTHDVGMGFLSALGARFTDGHGKELPPVGASLARVEAIDLSGLMPELSACELTAMCDVTNPLCGPEGSAAVYGPQKGADPAMVAELDEGSLHFIRLLEEAVGFSLEKTPGAGAAGGLGAAVLALGGTLRRGIEAVLDTLDFDKALTEADLVISGEGRVDGQSLRYGKVIGGIAERCRKAGKPLVLFAGSLAVPFEELAEAGCGAALPLTDGPMALEKALANARPLAENAARRLMSFLAAARSGVGNG